MRTDLSPLRSSFEILLTSPSNFSNRLFSFCLSSSVHFVRLFFLSLIGVIFPLKFIQTIHISYTNQSKNHNFIRMDYSLCFISSDIFLMSTLVSVKRNLSSSHSLFVNFPCLVFGCSLGMIQYLPKTKLPFASVFPLLSLACVNTLYVCFLW